MLSSIINFIKSVFPRIIQWIKGYFANKDMDKRPDYEGITIKKESKSKKTEIVKASNMSYIKNIYSSTLGAKWNDEINIFGIRDENDMRYSVWNDLICLAVRGKDHLWKIYSFIATCDPSAYWSSNANRRKHGWATNGAAHMTDGFHPNIWIVGKHRGYTALTQRGNKVKIWRDLNENFTDDDEERLIKLGISNNGYFGLNLHHGGNAKRIGLYSAGCQVIQRKKSFKKFMKLVMTNNKYLANKSAKYNYLLKNKSNVNQTILKALMAQAI